MTQRKNPRNIAIIVKDPKVGACVYQAVIEQINTLIQKQGAHSHVKQPNIIVYSRKPRAENTAKQVEEDSVIAKKLHCDAMFYPDTNIPDETSIKKIQVPIVFPPQAEVIPPLDSLKSDTTVDLKKVSDGTLEQIERWARAIVTASFSKEIDHARPEEPSRSQSTTLPAHPDGLIAIHGGMGPESGNGALMYMSDKYKGDIVLYSAARTPNTAKEYIIETYTDGYTRYENPLPHVEQDRKTIASIHPDVIWMACNTMHYFQPPLVKSVAVKTLHIIEEGLSKVPRNSKVLLLATKASVASGIFGKALEHLGREDIELIYPDEEQQKSVDSAIEDHVLQGKGYDIAAQKLEDVARYYSSVLGTKGCVMAGCTEIQVALKQGGGRLWNLEDHGKRMLKDRIHRFFRRKPDLIMTNISGNEASIFRDYELPRLTEFEIVDNLQQAADRSIVISNEKTLLRASRYGHHPIQNTMGI